MIKNGTTTPYTYDPQGNLLSKDSPQGRYLFLIDELNPTGYSQIIEEFTPQEVISYVYGLNLLAVIDSSGWHYLIHDPVNGSVIAVFDEDGNIETSLKYYPYGEIKEGNLIQNYLFTGERYDPDTNLYYLRNRWYSPTLKRFLTPDPLTPFSNLSYTYCNADPINKVDREGLFTLIEALTVTAIIGAVAVIDFACLHIGERAIMRATVEYSCIYLNNLPVYRRDPANIIVHGIGFHKYGWSDKFIERLKAEGVKGEFGEFLWSGFYMVFNIPRPGVKSSHLIAVKKLTESLKILKAKTDIINIIAHSWGTVIGFQSIEKFCHKINRFITMGSPLPENVEVPPAITPQHWINIFSTNDKVVKLGPLLRGWLIPGAHGYLFNKEGIQQKDVTAEIPYPRREWLKIHCAYWNNEEVIKTIVKELKK